MRIQFNTGRLYQANGQQIVCETVEDADRHGIIFNDLSRGIDGFIPMFKLPKDRFALEATTLHNYDYGFYRSDPWLCMDKGRARDLKWEGE